MSDTETPGNSAADAHMHTSPRPQLKDLISRMASKAEEPPAKQRSQSALYLQQKMHSFPIISMHTITRDNTIHVFVKNIVMFSEPEHQRKVFQIPITIQPQSQGSGDYDFNPGPDQTFC